MRQKTGTSPANFVNTASARTLGRAEGAHEKDRSDHQAVQARRSEGGAAGSRRPGHHRDRGQGLRPPEGPYRALSRRRICRGFPAQGEDRDRASPKTGSRPRSRRSRRLRARAASATARFSSSMSRKPSASAPARPARTQSKNPISRRIGRMFNRHRREDRTMATRRRQAHPEADQGQGSQIRRSALHRSARQVAARHLRPVDGRRGFPHQRHDVRRLVDRRLEGDQRVRHDC